MQRVVEMQERNIIGSATATVLSPIVDFYELIDMPEDWMKDPNEELIDEAEVVE